MSVLLFGPGGEPLLTRTDDPMAIEIPEDFDPTAEQPGVACAGCGCTDSFGCAGGCFWVAPGLCSSCAPDLAEAWRSA